MQKSYNTTKTKKEGENDYPLGKAVQEMGGYSHCVKDWKDTKVQINNFVAFGDNN